MPPTDPNATPPVADPTAAPAGDTPAPADPTAAPAEGAPTTPAA